MTERNTMPSLVWLVIIAPLFQWLYLDFFDPDWFRAVLLRVDQRLLRFLRRVCDEGQQGALLVSERRGGWKLRLLWQCLSLVYMIHDAWSLRPRWRYFSGDGHLPHLRTMRRRYMRGPEEACP